MTRSFTCIICPNGCEITAEYEGDTVYVARGTTCPEGDVYARQELTDPQRNIATSVLMEGGELPLASVRFSRPIPKKEISQAMGVIDTVRLQTPTMIDQVVLHNVYRQDADVIVTRSMTRANAWAPPLQFLFTPICATILRRRCIMRVGLIGLGIMGKPMVKNLLKAGYDLTVNDLNQAGVDETVAAGAKAATNAEIGETCDVVLTMVLNSSQVKAVILGEDDVATHMKPGSVFIDTSSISPVTPKEIVMEPAKRSIEMLDAPVSGGESKTIDGILSFMVGDKKEAFDQYKDILGAMGASVARCGDVGVGSTTKLTNQIIVACNIQALSEALTPTKMAGVDPEPVSQAIRGDLAGSTAVNARAPMMIEGNDKSGLKIDLYIKDLNNALDYACTVGSPLPMTAAAQEILQWLYSNGCGQDNRSSIIKCYKKLTGIEPL